ncbi:MAG: hypothetical protein ACTSW2_08670 [Alphaproteobacteria bacterium]
MKMCKTHTRLIKPLEGQGQKRRLTRLMTIAGAALLAAVLVAGWGNAGIAAVPQDDPFADLEVLGAAEMAEKRGGFLDAALGISLSLGANIRTAINGSLVLETLVKFSNSGVTQITNTIADGANLTGLTFLSADGTAIAGIDVVNSTGPVTFSANGAHVTVPAGFQGLVAQTDTGVVAAVNKITSEQFANLVVNSDPGAIIRQELQINVDVSGFAQLQKNVRFNATMAKFRQAMRSASLSALGIN